MKSVSLLLRVTYRGADWLETKSHSSHDQCELGALETCKGGVARFVSFARFARTD
jgi:hypothetical protein